MKKITVVLILLTLLAAAVSAAPIFGERLVIEEEGNEEVASLVFWNFTNLSGQVIRSFEYHPSDMLYLNADGSVNEFFVTTTLERLESVLNTALKETDYKVRLENGVLSATILYESLTDMYIAMGETGFEYEEPDAEISSGFFFNTAVSKMKTVWDAVGDETTVPGFFKSMAVAAGEREDKLEYVYFYGTKYKPEAVASDADKIVYSDRLYFHQFYMNSATTGREITFTQKNPNPTGWYVVAILAGCAVAAGITAVFFVKRKRKKD